MYSLTPALYIHGRTHTHKHTHTHTLSLSVDTGIRFSMCTCTCVYGCIMVQTLRAYARAVCHRLGTSHKCTARRAHSPFCRKSALSSPSNPTNKESCLASRCADTGTKTRAHIQADTLSCQRVVLDCCVCRRRCLQRIPGRHAGGEACNLC